MKTVEALFFSFMLLNLIKNSILVFLLVQHVLLKKFTVFLKFKFLKKLRYSVIFFLSQSELASAH